VTSVAKLQSELEALRQEIATIRSEVHPTPWRGVDVPFLGLLGLGKPSAKEALSLPDLRLGALPPAHPVPPPASLSAQGEAVDRVREARLYLIRTATPGGTMERQTPTVAISRLHPEFALRLAEAVKRARDNGLPGAGVYSAYRPPAFGVGGFRDKFMSMHSYGLAVDMTGIGGPGSWAARAWQKIVQSVGLYLPYGPYNRAEFNHTQLLPDKVASNRLRSTITASKPKIIEEMWAASGVKIPEPTASASLLPTVDFALASAKTEVATVAQFLHARRHALWKWKS
jgi:hypothetical protein